MNIHRTRLITGFVAALAVLLAAACQPAAAPPASPATIVQTYYDALNAKEFDRAATFMAPDIVTTDPSGMVAGKEPVKAYWQGLIESGFSFKLSEVQDTDGRVTSCFEVQQNGALVDQGCSGVTLVRAGLIIFDGLTGAEPEFVVQRYYQALNAKDVDLAMSFVAADAVFANPTGQYTGAAEIRPSLEGLVKDGITFELTNLRPSDGRVVYDYRVLQGEALLDSGTDGLTIVNDGRIVFDGTERTEP